MRLLIPALFLLLVAAQRSHAQCEVNATFTNVLCFNGNTGSANATANGTTGNVMFTWRKISNNDSIGNTANIANLIAGTYYVTIKDANGCMARDTVTIIQPPKFDFQRTQDSVSCFGGKDGCAQITASGGTPPYNFLWSTGTTATATTSSSVCNLDAKFHSVIVTDQNGCDAATLIQVLEPPRLTVDSFTLKNPICFGEKNGSITVHVSGGTKAYQFLWQGGPASANYPNLGAGSYTITVTDFNKCSATASSNLNQPTELIGKANNVKDEICFEECNGAAEISASGGAGQYQFEWSDPKIPNGSTQSNKLCPADYKVTITDKAGCHDTVFFKVNAAQRIDLQASSNPPSCAGLTNGRINTQTSGGAGGYQYLWSNGRTTANLLQVACGTYTLTLTDANNCKDSLSVPIKCPDTLRVKDVLVTNTRCFGEKNGQLTAVVLGGTGKLSFQWNDPAKQKDSIATGLAAGFYNVTITDFNDCAVVAVGEVKSPDSIKISLSATPATCFGGMDGSASVTQSSGGNGNFVFTWDNLQAGPQISALKTGPYTVTATDAKGCTSSASISVGQPDSLRLRIDVARPACFGQKNARLEAIASGGNGLPYKYEWSNNASTATLSDLAAGVYTLTLSDAKGCTLVKQQTAQELPQIVLNVFSSAPSCFGACDANAAINKIMGGAGGADSTKFTYQWSRPGEKFTLIKNICAGVSYTVTATDAFGCTGTETVSPANPQPVEVSIQKQDVTCFGAKDGSAIATATSGMPVTIYEWDNNVIGRNNTGLAPGRYIVRAEDIKGCEGRDTVFIIEPSPISLSFVSTTLRCSGERNAQARVRASGGIPPYKIKWDNGSTDSLRNNLGPGDYTVTVSDKNSCTAIGSVRITDPDSLLIAFENTTPICFGDRSGRIKILANGGEKPYRYRLNEGEFGGSSVFFGLQAGIYQLTVRDNKGCTASISDTLSQPLRIEVDLGLDTCLVLGDSLRISPEISNAFGRVLYIWRSASTDTLRCLDAECSEVQAKPKFGLRAQLTVEDERGCFGTDEMDICVKKPRGVYIPSGFSPNGDFENDRLVVHGKGRQIKRVLDFKVYDRWGELLYQAKDLPVNDPTSGWDGTFRGETCLAGVYIWRVEVEYNDGFKEVESGQTMLIR